MKTRAAYFAIALMYATAARPEILVEVSPTTYVAIVTMPDCSSGEVMNSYSRTSAVKGALSACGKRCKLIAVFKIVPQ